MVSDKRHTKPQTRFERIKADAEHERWWADYQAKMPPELKAALQIPPPSGSPLSLLWEIGAAAADACTASPVSDLLRKLEVGAAMSAESCLQGFMDTGNPLCAIGALANWPKGRPLDETLQKYLRDCMWPIYAMALQIAIGGDGAPSPSEAVRRVPELLGLAGRQGTDNAFSDLVRWCQEQRAAERYRKQCEAGEKSEDIITDLATKEGVSAATMRRRVSAGRKQAADDQRKPDVRAVRKRPRSK